MRLKWIGLTLLASMPAHVSAAQPIPQAMREQPKIVVTGYGEVMTPPDLAIISYTARGEGSTSDEAVHSMTAQSAKIETELRKIDLTAEPRTDEVKVVPVRSNDCGEQDYDSPQMSKGACTILGYVATQSVTVRTIAVKDAGTMVGLVGRGGAFDAQIRNFGLRDARLAQQQAIDSALSNATTKATAIAAASHVALGPILSINTNEQQTGGYIIVTAQKRAASPSLAIASPPPPPVPITINPELITTRANLTVTYMIGQ